MGSDSLFQLSEVQLFEGRGGEGEKGRRGEGEKGRRGEGEKGRGGEIILLDRLLSES
ncbi:MAG: hypothetical protein F6J89_00590 [Symploca sp. SIO1C4]|uniref:Uncharacterized protein n=1 Tax=Symploca sp. SIO1C4 TaxID=2607765 RepID=A0A6B3N6E3_9CYAN|nr:hypothetical protein [Symploca sp. SIO1C4]